MLVLLPRTSLPFWSQPSSAAGGVSMEGSWCYVHYPHVEDLPEVLGEFMSDSPHVGTAPLLSHWLQFSQGDECLHALPGVTSPDIHRLRCHIPSNTPHKGRVEGGLLPSFLASGNVTASLRSSAPIQACTFPVWRQKKGPQGCLFQSTPAGRTGHRKAVLRTVADSGNDSTDFVPKVRRDQAQTFSTDICAFKCEHTHTFKYIQANKINIPQPLLILVKWN